MEGFSYETCCACLGRCDGRSMFSLAVPETRKLFKECTNIMISKEDPLQNICIMCYKQCEIWKIFKRRCQFNRTMMPFHFLEPTEQPVDDDDGPVTVKEEPESADYYEGDSVDEINVSHGYTVDEEIVDDDEMEDQYAESSSGYDPLGGQRVKKKRGRKKKIRVESESPTNGTNDPDPAAKKFKSPGTLSTHNGSPISDASRTLYLKTYNDFLRWKEKTSFTEINEAVVVDYFKYITPLYSATTLTNKLSHIANTLSTFHNIKIDGWAALRGYVRDIKMVHDNQYMPVN